MAATIRLPVQGRETKQQTFMKQFNSGECNSKSLLPLFSELKENMTKLDKNQCHELVMTVLNIDWLHQEMSVIEKYKAFVLDFISVHPNYLKIVLKTLVKKFELGKLNSGREKVDLQHVHDLLADISRLVPMMANDLVPVLGKNCPYYLHDVNIQENYVSNLLNVINYLPLKQKDILDIVINQIIQLDVHTPKKVISESELKTETSQEKIQDLEVMQKSMNTLDTLMKCLFNFIHDSCYVEDQLNWEATKKLYADVLSVFNNRILTTQACSHVPFILFYLCSMKLPLCEAALDSLWKKVENPNSSPVVRQTAVNYIGSFLTHASFITTDVVVTCMDILAKWIHEYIDGQDECVNSIDPNLHRIFYSVSQALYFVFIFRHDQLLNMTNGFSYLQGLKFERMVTSPLNPLRWCHPNIVDKFASITRHYQLVYCDTIINRNLRFFLPTESAITVSIDFNFPFNHYLLENSKSFLNSIYRAHETIGSESETAEEQDDDFLNYMDVACDGNLLSLSPVIRLIE